MEIISLIEMLVDIANDYGSLAAIIGLCGSFLFLREDTVSFVHQSVKDFLMKKASKEILPLGMGNVRCTIFSRSVLAMSNTLRRDIYGLRAPGTLSTKSSRRFWPLYSTLVFTGSIIY
jgi:hypothetical protein